MSDAPNFKALYEAAQSQIQELQTELQRARQNFENLFENAGDSIFIVDVSTYEIVDANAHAARRLGYDRDELVDMKMDEIEVFDEEADANALAWESSFSRTRVYEYRYRHKDGTLIPVEVSGRIVNVGDQMFILNFVRDIRVRKQLEAEREALIADLQSFDHTVAHDLKSPLATIESYSSFLADIWSELSAEEIENHLQSLVNSSRRAANIVNELMLFASVRKDQRADTAPLDMAEIVHHVFERQRASLEQSDAQVQLPDTWHKAIGYAPWIQEVWVNYLSNAIKYGGQPPVITLGSSPEPENKVRFWMRDNGAGIAPDQIAQIFQEFTRLAETRIEGHGLGLSIVKRIIEKLDGQVGVESTVGEGSTFYFILPAANDA